jgi:hypothetical protein
LLGLDALYREAIKPHEMGELLTCARTLAGALRLGIVDIPVEGYYNEDRSLSEYFRLVRGLQTIDASRINEVASLPAFQRLRQVTGSPVFGVPEDTQRMLPTARNALTQALRETRPDWTIPAITAAALRIAVATQDCSLVGLAARGKNPVILAALGESVVLYAERVVLSRIQHRVFEWRVDPDLTEAARRFVSAFNLLFDEDLPYPGPERAESFWKPGHKAEIIGRCVSLGRDTSQPPRHYHWGICCNLAGELTVQDFWRDRLWTTEHYRATLTFGNRCL